MPGTIASGATPPPQNPSQPTTPNGDIILVPDSPSPEKKRNLPLIIAIVVAMIVVIAVVTVLAVTSSSGKKGGGSAQSSAANVDTVKEKFTPYYNYLVFGPDVPENNTAAPSNVDDWYFATILSNGTTDADGLADYAGELDKKFTEFYDVAKDNAALSDINFSDYGDVFYAMLEYLLVDSQNKNSLNDDIFKREYKNSIAITVFEYARKYAESNQSNLAAYKNFISMYNNIVKPYIGSATLRISHTLGEDDV